MTKFSVNPLGEKFQLPEEKDYQIELEKLTLLTKQAHDKGQEVVVLMGAEIRVHDPYVDHWYEFESQDTYPATGQSWSRFFRNQDGLKDLKVEKDLPSMLKGAEAMVLAVPHHDYLHLKPADIVEWAGKPLAIIDCFGILDDDTIREYFRLGCEVKALGRGHVQRLKKELFQ